MLLVPTLLQKNSYNSVEKDKYIFLKLEDNKNYMYKKKLQGLLGSSGNLLYPRINLLFPKSLSGCCVDVLN